MKISINSKFLDGPYGGGMQFANGLKKFLESRGVQVVNHLNDPDIDVILHVNPFPFLTGKASAYSFLDAYAYKLKHPGVKIVQRVNECDERKNTKFMNKLLVNSLRYADHVVFIASWLKPLLEHSGLSKDKPSSVILSGPDKDIFNQTDKEWWQGSGKLKVVTHHWSPGYKKGHAVYQALDRLLDDPEMAEKFEFTYIGSKPISQAATYRNTRFVPPLFGVELGEELKKHHVYITASENDPGPMHPVEGMASGLPILYIDSGSLAEQCAGFGIIYRRDNLKEKLLEMRQTYDKWKEKIKKYSNSSELMGEAYLDLFTDLVKQAEPSFARAPAIKRFWFYVYKLSFGLVWKIKKYFIRH